MVKIPLSQGQVALIDDEDFELVSRYKWHAYRNHNSFYAQAHDTPTSTVYLHRVIIGAQRGEKVDHIDGNGLNNTRANLRIATHQQNMQNRHTASGKHTPYKGVSPTKSAIRPWRARIYTDGKEQHLGCFGIEIMAAFAYDRKARELFGEFACPNFHPDYEGAYADFVMDTL